MTGYMAEMRKLVGHRTIIQCGASVICVNSKGEILLGKRGDTYQWGYAGGSVEIDESIESCAKRELYEEMGIVAESLELFYVNSGAEAHYIYPNGDEVSNIEIVYICREWSGNPDAKDGEMEELRFFKIDEIKIEDVFPPIRSVVKKYINTQSKALL